MIRSIVFDIGNVLLDFAPMKFLLKLYGEEEARTLHKLIFSSQEWLALDRGTLTEEEAIEIISRRCPGYSASIRYVIGHWTEMLIPIEDSVQIFEALKEKGYQTYLLSNFHRQAFQEVFSKYGFLRRFDGKIISSHVGLLKPEAEIFERLCAEYGLKPEESLFIDDTVCNVEAARELGFRVVLFKNPEILGAELQSLGIEGF